MAAEVVSWSNKAESATTKLLGKRVLSSFNFARSPDSQVIQTGTPSRNPNATAGRLANVKNLSFVYSRCIYDASEGTMVYRSRLYRHVTISFYGELLNCSRKSPWGSEALRHGSAPRNAESLKPVNLCLGVDRQPYFLFVGASITGTPSELTYHGDTLVFWPISYLENLSIFPSVLDASLSLDHSPLSVLAGPIPLQMSLIRSSPSQDPPA